MGTEKGVTTDRQKGFSRGIRSFGKQEIKLIFKIAQDSNPIPILLGLFFRGGGGGRRTPPQSIHRFRLPSLYRVKHGHERYRIF